MPSDRREVLRSIVFEAQTPVGRWFDAIVFALIALSMAIVVAQSVPDLDAVHGPRLLALEWALTIAFTLEYAVRLYCARSAKRYAGSFFGLVDLLALLPSYLGLFVDGMEGMLIIRSLRLLRVFRVLGLGRFAEHGDVLLSALRAAAPKAVVFLTAVTMISMVLGALMHLVEGPRHGFVTILHGMYWAVTTLTTVGYGDFVAHTGLGRFIASVTMVLGYGVIAVPTGIMSTEMSRVMDKRKKQRECWHCGTIAPEIESRFCHVCGTPLHGDSRIGPPRSAEMSAAE